MSQKKHEQKVLHTTFLVLYGAFVNKVLAEEEDPMARLFEIGTRIGGRMADEFFMNTRPRRNMDLQEISQNISESFFPAYFSFHPAFAENMVSLARFPVLSSSCEHLEIVRGILHSVYNWLSRDGVRFEVVQDGDDVRMYVRSEPETQTMFVAGICTEPRESGSGITGS